MKLAIARIRSLMLVPGFALSLALSPASQAPVPGSRDTRQVATKKRTSHGRGHLFRNSEQRVRNARHSAAASLPDAAEPPLWLVLLLTTIASLAGFLIGRTAIKTRIMSKTQLVDVDRRSLAIALRGIRSAPASCATAGTSAPGKARGSGGGNQTLSGTAPFWGCGGDWRRRPLRPALGGSGRRSSRYRRCSGFPRRGAGRPGPSEFWPSAIAFRRSADTPHMVLRQRLGRTDHTLVNTCSPLDTPARLRRTQSDHRRIWG